MGKILTDAVALLEHFLERRRDDGGLRVRIELGADPVHQIDRAGKDAGRRPAKSSRPRVFGDPLEAPAPAGSRTHSRLARRDREWWRRTRRRGRFPGRSLRGAARRAAGKPTPASGLSMRRLRCARFRSGCSRSGYRRNRAAGGAVRRPRPDIDAVRNQLLAVVASRLEPQRAARETDRTFVAVGGDVTDVVDHARPVSFSGRLALGPCGK